MPLDFDKAIVKRAAKSLLREVQVRKKLPSDQYLLELGRSVYKRQIAPLIIREDDVVLDGHLRLEAVLRLDREHLLDCIVARGQPTPSEIAEIQLVSAMHREGLNSHDQALACHEWMVMNPKGTARELAERIDRSPATVSKLVSLFKCTPETVKAAEDGKIAMHTWYAISQLKTPEEQNGLLHMHLGVAAGETASARTPRPVSLRLDRATVPLSSGAKVSVSGESLDLESLIEALSGALEAARRGLRDRLDISTWQKVMRDKARAGV